MANLENHLDPMVLMGQQNESVPKKDSLWLHHMDLTSSLTLTFEKHLRIVNLPGNVDPNQG